MKKYVKNNVKKADGREEEAIRLVLAALTTAGVTAWRQENRGEIDVDYLVKFATGAIISAKTEQQAADALQKGCKASFRRIKGSVRGVPDVIGYTRQGRFIGVEIKIGSDTLKADQVAFMSSLAKSNGIVMVWRNHAVFVSELAKMKKLSII